MDDESNAERFFRGRTELQQAIRNSDAFKAWRNNYRELTVDGSKLFVRKGEPMVSGGDRLLDEHELMLEWARINGLIADEPKKGE